MHKTLQKQDSSINASKEKSSKQENYLMLRTKTLMPQSNTLIQRQENLQQPRKSSSTGIPTQMKERFEGVSGFSFDDVKVHYNSDKPAQLQALAYTQGNQVYIGAGQEKHLGHELGHVVQQKQGIVRASEFYNGFPINRDKNLETEATNISENFKADYKNKITLYSADIIQCAPVEDFITTMKVKDKELNLYSYIYGDGFGDAGMLGFLRRKIDNQEIKNSLKISKINLFATYNLEHSDVTKQDTIRSLIGGNVMLHEGSVDNGRSEHSRQDDDDFEIQYPVSDPLYKPESLKVLKIKEMGILSEIQKNEKNAQSEQKTGYLHEGIGYGVPELVPPKTADESRNLTDDEIVSSVIDYFKPSVLTKQTIEKAWLVNVKSYSITEQRDSKTAINEVANRDYRNNQIIEMAKEKTNLLILTGQTEDKREQDVDLTIVYLKFIPNEMLKKLFIVITEGVVISGGEGMFVESLGAENETATILAGRYAFQYREMAYSLLNSKGIITITIEDNDLTRNAIDEYRFCCYDTEYYYVTCEKAIAFGKSYTKYVATNILSKKIVFINDEEDIQVNTALSAIFLPLNINGGIKFEIPKCSSVTKSMEQFLVLKKDFVARSWFKCFDPTVPTVHEEP